GRPPPHRSRPRRARRSPNPFPNPTASTLALPASRPWPQDRSAHFDTGWYADSGTFLGGHYSIPAGADDTYDHIWSNISAGSHTLTFVANFDNLVVELNKGNSQATINIDVAECPSPTP